MKIKFKIDANGVVSGFSYHDGRVLGMHVDGSELTIFIRNAVSKTFELRASGVRYLNADEFWEGNVLSHIFLFERDSQNAQARMLSERREVPMGVVTSLVEQGYLILAVECSIGVSATALCRSVEIHET